MPECSSKTARTVLRQRTCAFCSTKAPRGYSAATNNAPYNIAWARETDTPRLEPLFSALYNHDVPEAEAPTEATRAAHIARLLAPTTPHRLAVAWASDRRAVGLAAVAFCTSISDPRAERWTQMELKELFVLPGHRSAGLGTVLMAWVEEKARETSAHRIDWHVKTGNLRGIAFYERFGGSFVKNRLSMRKMLC